MWTYNTNYLAHYGIFGQKWGVRRFQNPDGSLTKEGQERYRVRSVTGHIARALYNTPLGQRLVGVGLNKGYRQDKKDIKKIYNEKKTDILQKDVDKETRNKKLKNLKSDYKKTKAEARVSAAEAVYPWQSTKTNTKIQSQNMGKGILKGFAFGGYGSLNYDRLTANDFKRLPSAGMGFLSSLADYATNGTLSIGDYIAKRGFSDEVKYKYKK